jgi:hypothetical protein
MQKEVDYYLIVDNLSVHHSNVIKDYINTIPNLNIIYMLPYSGFFLKKYLFINFFI